jgi:signal transduction histidine kinase
LPVGRLNALIGLIALAVFWIAFGTTGTVYDTDRTGHWLMLLVGLIVGLPVLLIRRRPLTGLMVSVGAAYVLAETVPLRGHPPWPWLVIQGLAIFVLLFVTCAREPLGRAVGGWLVTALLFAVELPNNLWAGWVVGVTSIAVIGALTGRLARTRRALVVQEEVSSAEKARRVLLEERARIARDLHDIVAHHMSLVVVQAETAGYRVPDLSDAARAELLAIGETARSALTETRALLSVLRQDDQKAEDAPQPGVEQLGELVDAAQRAGVRLNVNLDDGLDRLRPGASLAAYRIAQEALANASRHASGAPVSLRVRSARSNGLAGIWLRVENDAPSGAPVGGRGVREVVAGHGITGMRERAAAADGRLTVGPTPGGGFAVEVFLPAEPAPRPEQPVAQQVDQPVQPRERTP